LNKRNFGEEHLEMAQDLPEIQITTLLPGGSPPLRFLEISFHPLLKNVFPRQTEYIDTRFRWTDTRKHEVRQNGVLRRLGSLAWLVVRALRICARQDYDVVVTRCLGPVNSFGQSWLSHLARVFMGYCFQLLARYAARGPRVRLAVIDLTDHITIHPRDRKLAWTCDLYFKRELADNHWHTLESILPRGACAGATRNVTWGARLRSKLRPMALGIESEAILQPISNSQKKYDLFYCGASAEIPVRENLGKELENIAKQGWAVFAPEQRLSLEEYRAAVQQSRLCLSPGGIGWDCYRHYEVVAFGSIPVLIYRTLCSISPFRHGQHCFYYDPQVDLVGQVEEWLKLPQAFLDQMVMAAQEHLKQHFTFDALATYLVREFEKLPR
jgi:hypothetical protein